MGDAVVRGLGAGDAVAVLDSSGDDESMLARAANAFRADLCVWLRSTVDREPHCLYFETAGFRSEAGLVAATAIRDAVAPVLGANLAVTGRAYPILRETTMAAVVCELIADGDAGGAGHGRATFRRPGARGGQRHPALVRPDRRTDIVIQIQ